MVNPVNESFSIQEEPDKRENTKKGKRSGMITNKKAFMIFGIGLVGVLGVAGVAIGVTNSSSGSSEETEAAPASSPVQAFRLGHPQHITAFVDPHNNNNKYRHPHAHHRRRHHEEKETLLENAKMKRNEKLKQKSKTGVTVCETPECAMSAASISEAMDPTADPCEDFFQFACGGWYESHPVTDHSRGSFYAAENLIQNRMQMILESEPGETDPQPLIDIRTHYSSCMDTETINSLGITSLWKQIAVQGGMPMVMENWMEANFTLEESLAYILKIDAYPIIGVGIDSDFRNTTNKILYVQEGNLGLSSTYLSNPDDYTTQINYYRTYISDSAKLLRDGIGTSVDDVSIDQEVDDLINFEISLAKTMSFIPLNKSDLLVKTTISEFQTATDDGTPGQVDWLKFFKAMFGETDVLITEEEPLYVFGEKYFRKLSTLLSTTSSRTLANYIGWWWIRETGPETTYAMRNVSNTFDYNVYGSTPSNRTMECVDQVNYNLGFPMSRAYVDLYFPEEAKVQTEELIELMRTAFQSLLDENTWMAPEDLVVAKEKLDAITDHAAYPDWIKNNAELTLAYQGLEIKEGEHYDNIIRMSSYFDYWELETFRDEVQKVFLMPPTVVNAFYDVFANSITILAGILQPPFYTQNSLAALNYGGIGMVIGHEFTHGFDDNGRHFDKDGNLADWWSQETIDKFVEKSQCFVDQYNVYSPPELAGTEYSNMTVDGTQTLGENIADNGGIREAFRAYLDYVDKYGEEPRLPGLEDYTPNQLFFLGFANVWCEHRTNEDIVRQLNTDPHSPGRFRVLGPLSNDADFSNTFNCPLSSAMNKGNDSCILW